jgi:hypothetical protein
MAHSCPRQWAYHYLFDVKAIEGEALRDGNAVHEQVKCLGQGSPPPHGPETRYGKMARELITYASPRSSKAVFEIIKQIELPEYGIKVDLRCDFMDLCPPSKPHGLFKDWKTTGAERPTSKLPNGKLWVMDDLTDDWQANIYAFLLMRQFWKVPVVEAEWVYCSKKFKDGQTPRTWPVNHLFHYDISKAWFDKMVPPTVALIREMKAAKASGQLDNARLVPHNAPSCEYEGKFCDAAGHCRMISSPVLTYQQLHLPMLKGT